MSKVEKRLSRWRIDTPTDVPVDEVLSILDRFFDGRYVRTGGSHIVVTDKRLIGLPGYGPLGDFSVPVKGGQRVKGFYLKRLAETIYILEELEK